MRTGVKGRCSSPRAQWWSNHEGTLELSAKLAKFRVLMSLSQWLGSSSWVILKIFMDALIGKSLCWTVNFLSQGHAFLMFVPTAGPGTNSIYYIFIFLSIVPVDCWAFTATIVPLTLEWLLMNMDTFLLNRPILVADSASRTFIVCDSSPGLWMGSPLPYLHTHIQIHRFSLLVHGRGLPAHLTTACLNWLRIGIETWSCVAEMGESFLSGQVKGSIYKERSNSSWIPTLSTGLLLFLFKLQEWVPVSVFPTWLYFLNGSPFSR